MTEMEKMIEMEEMAEREKMAEMAKITARSYLSQYRLLGSCMTAKLHRLKKIYGLKSSCTAEMSTERKEIDVMEEEVKCGMDKLVILKANIENVINAVPDPVYRLLLEKRYLCCQTWAKIAADMGYCNRYIYKLHDRALGELGRIGENRGESGRIGDG